jgi:cytochrome c556
MSSNGFARTRRQTISPLRPRRIACTFAALGFSVSAAVASQPDATAITKHRQDVMHQMGLALKAVHGFVTGDASAAAASQAAAQLNDLAKQVPTLFPLGTSQLDLPGVSAAKPDIWDNPDDFAALEATLSKGAANLQKAVASGDPAQTDTALATVAHDACGACHQTYRGKSD